MNLIPDSQALVLRPGEEEPRVAPRVLANLEHDPLPGLSVHHDVHGPGDELGSRCGGDRVREGFGRGPLLTVENAVTRNDVLAVGEACPEMIASASCGPVMDLLSEKSVRSQPAAPVGTSIVKEAPPTVSGNAGRAFGVSAGGTNAVGSSAPTARARLGLSSLDLSQLPTATAPTSAIRTSAPTDRAVALARRAAPMAHAEGRQGQIPCLSRRWVRRPLPCVPVRRELRASARQPSPVLERRPRRAAHRSSGTLPRSSRSASRSGGTS
jgi:hypothetical protein